MHDPLFEVYLHKTGYSNTYEFYVPMCQNLRDPRIDLRHLRETRA